MKNTPVAFIGHGSPLNAIEINDFTDGWKKMANVIGKPKSILVISAHWMTRDERINNEIYPRTVYDMYGFPQELYDITYEAPGNPELADNIISMLGGEPNIIIDNSWGFDHGNWSVLYKMYPDHDIPVVQISINTKSSLTELYQIGHKLYPLRSMGVLIMGSGNIVHNLSKIDWEKEDGYDWANAFDTEIHDMIYNYDHQSILNYQTLGKKANLSVPTTDHFLPLIYILGATTKSDQIQTFNYKKTLGSLSMTSYLWL